MKTDANWLLRVGTGVLSLSFAFAVASCGGHGSSPLGTSGANKPSGSTPTTTTSSSTTTNSQTITSEDIAKLPPDQQKLLTDPGWNQPYIAPDPGTTGLPAPSTDELLRLTREKLAAPEDIVPRGMSAPPAGAKSTSWIGQGSGAYGNVSPPYGGNNNVPDFDHIANVIPGEYYQFAKSATPTYGCNADGSNGGNLTPTNALEDTLANFDITKLGGPNQAINYVLEGLSAPNWFNTGGAHGGNAQSAIYQIFCTVRSGDPSVPSPTGAKFGEISFRSDKTQYAKGPGGGVGAGGTQCYTGPSVAHAVAGYYWNVFNSNNVATPNQVPVRNFNILVAPADDGNGVGSTDPSFQSSGGTQTEYQSYYFGSVGACYGGAQIIGLTATTSSCSTFKAIFTPGSPTYKPGFFYNPVYGVVLKRWQQLAPPGSGAWKGPLGSPVFGPVAYNGGNPTSQPGKKWYAWGWYFEKGFMWYVDNDQTLFPNTPDEAQVYTYSNPTAGNNTYCTGGTYTQQQPSTFFLGNSNATFKVNVSVTGYSSDGTNYTAPTFNTTLGRYQVGMTASGPTTENIWISANASGYGGQPDASCNYSTIIWAWRDGTITGPLPYNTGQTASHLYSGGKQGQTGNHQNIYVLRVQVADSQGNLAYGDSLPLELGAFTSALLCDVLCVDAVPSGSESLYGVGSPNYVALVADLVSIKGVLPNFVYKEESYQAGTTLSDAKASKVVIWFHGGPSAQNPASQDNDKYTSAEVADMQAIMSAPNPRPIINMAQNVGIGDGSNSYYNGILGYYWISPVATPATPSSGAYSTPATFLDGIAGLAPTTAGSSYQNMPCSGGNNFLIGSFDDSSIQQYIFWYNNPTNIGETYNGTNSSGKVPSYLQSSTYPHRQITMFSDNGSGSHPPGRAGTVAGGYPNERWDNGDCNEVGNATSGIKNWTITFPWKMVQDAGNSNTIYGSSGLKSYHLLQNIIASLDNTIGSGLGTPTFNSYSGTAEIVSVTAHQFLNAGGINQGQTATPGTDYPDTGAYPGIDSNVYRKTNAGLPGGSNYLINKAERVTTGNDDLLNGNDLQFDFPFYAYVLDPNGSVTANGTGTLSGDETITYGGLLLVNNGTWTRVNPAGAGYKNWATLSASLPSANQKSAAGYYWGTAGSLAGVVRAGYGQAQPQLYFDNSQGGISFECIAHWPTSLTYGANPATVRWSLYPAHGVNDLNNPGHYYGERSSFFTKWISDMDIDPSVTPPAGAPLRNSFSYNIPDFNYTGNLGQGRVADFNFGTIKGWDGDIDRDNVRGEDGVHHGTTPDDKFPARCRLFTDYTNYIKYTTYTQYPDWVPDPATFVEGGVYIVDGGPAITKVAITDDPAKTDPKDNVTTVSDHVWDVKLGFIILYGDPGYKVEYNPDSTGSGVWALVPGNPPNASDPMDPLLGYPANGSHFPTVRVTNPTYGDYFFAVRVTDLSGGAGSQLSAVYTWPNKVSLKPPFGAAVMQDPLSHSVGGRDAQKMKADIETIYGANTVTFITSSQLSSGLSANSLNNYDVIGWAVDQGSNMTNWPSEQGWSSGGGSGANFTAVKNAHINKAGVVMFAEGSDGEFDIGVNGYQPYTAELRQILPYRHDSYTWYAWYFGGFPEANSGQGWNVTGPMATTPNAVGNFTSFEADAVGNRGGYFGNTDNILTSSSDAANYPSSNCGYWTYWAWGFFGNSYTGGAYARRAGSVGQTLAQADMNWGDLLTTQGSVTRAHLLENLLCGGDPASKFNSPTFP